MLEHGQHEGDPDRITIPLHPVPVEGLDLDQEIALHEDIQRRREAPPELDEATEALLRERLAPTLHGGPAKRLAG